VRTPEDADAGRMLITKKVINMKEREVWGIIHVVRLHSLEKEMHDQQ
jgi:signal-transduction protein with cAMP-binding, CBS, and nucleotidyltransferase domain